MADEIRWFFHMNSPPTWNTVFTWGHQIKNPKFNDVCVLFKHSKMLENAFQEAQISKVLQEAGGGGGGVGHAIGAP